MRFQNVYMFLFVMFANLPLGLIIIDRQKNPTENSSKTKRLNRKADVDVNFCMLNHKGEPSTLFKEGEHFSFSLSLQNRTGDTLFLDNSFLADGNGFCSVFNESNQLVGSPFSYNGVAIVSSDAHPFFGKDNVYKLTVPWSDSRNNWSTLHYNFRGTIQKNLPRGKYFTIFKHRFCFDRMPDLPSLCIQPITTKIEFEVR